MSNKDFHDVVVRLFASMNMQHDQAATTHQGYTIRVDDTLHIDLIGLQQGFINLRSVIGTLPDKVENDMLLRMLYANNFAFEHPPVSIGIDPDTASVTVWSRQALSELKNDVRCDWFERFVKLASVIHHWLHSSNRTTPLAASSMAGTRDKLHMQGGRQGKSLPGEML